jgi:hypothetical protein
MSRFGGRIFATGRIPAEDGRVQRECSGGGESRELEVIERPSEQTEIGDVRHVAEGPLWGRSDG